MRMLLLLASGCFAAQSQTASVTPAFEAASVKPAPPPNGSGMSVSSDGGPGTSRPERYTAENMDFAGLVMYAYDIKRFQISGPDWMRSERYNISAIVPANATNEQFRTMLQNLLAERFALKVHWETREMPIYELMIAKGGPKLGEAKPDDPTDADEAAPKSPPGLAKTPDGFPSLPEGKAPMMLMMSTRTGQPSPCAPTTKALRESHQRCRTKWMFQCATPRVSKANTTSPSTGLPAPPATSIPPCWRNSTAPKPLKPTRLAPHYSRLSSSNSGSNSKRGRVRCRCW